MSGNGHGAAPDGTASRASAAYDASATRRGGHHRTLRDGTIIGILSGSPTAEQTAAVVAALEPAGAASAKPEPGNRSNWLRAARREGAGHRLIGSRTDLR